MQLFIQKEKAIKLLRDRIHDINSTNFNGEGWKQRTILDLKTIFGPATLIYFSIQNVRLTPLSFDRDKGMWEERKTVKSILEGYIGWIEDNAQEKLLEKPLTISPNVEELKSLLQSNIQTLIKEKEDCLKQNIKLTETASNLTAELGTKERIISELNSLVSSWKTLSLSDLTKAFFNRPIRDVIPDLGILFAVITATFFGGRYYQEYVSDNHYSGVAKENEKLRVTLDSQANAIVVLGNRVKTASKGFQLPCWRIRRQSTVRHIITKKLG